MPNDALATSEKFLFPHTTHLVTQQMGKTLLTEIVGATIVISKQISKLAILDPLGQTKSWTKH